MPSREACRSACVEIRAFPPRWRWPRPAPTQAQAPRRTPQSGACVRTVIGAAIIRASSLDLVRAPRSLRARDHRTRAVATTRLDLGRMMRQLPTVETEVPPHLRTIRRGMVVMARFHGAVGR